MRRLYGFHPVRESLQRRPEAARRAWVLKPRRGGARRSEIERLCQSVGVPLLEVEATDAVWLGGGVHNGFAIEIDDTVPHGAGSDLSFLVLAEDVQDPRNLGALLRVCEGAGVGAVYVRDRGSAPLSAVAIKAAAGASEWLTIERIGSSAQKLEQLRNDGYWIYGLAAGGEAPWNVDLTGPIVLCVGGEEEGLRRLTRERCDRLLGLPMRGRVASLNLATAASAVLYEAVRQRSGLR